MGRVTRAGRGQVHMPRASCVRMRCASAELFSAAKWTCPRDCHGLARRQVRLGILLAGHAARRSPLTIGSVRCDSMLRTAPAVSTRV
jgi:hypothetical protein